MEQYFTTRKSCRTFSNKEVSDSLLKEILEAAMKASTTGNMQLYSVVITRDKTKKNELAPAHFRQSAFVNAPVILTFCADFNRFVKWCNFSEATAGYDNLQSFIAAALDTVIFAQQFVTIAEKEGLGTCYLGTTTYNPELISQVLNLPKRVVPIVTVSVGYPAGEQTETDRLPVESILHDEKYKDYTETDIKRYYSEKEQREDSKAFIAENNKKTLAQVFTDIRYPKNNNEIFSKAFGDFLKSQYPGITGLK